MLQVEGYGDDGGLYSIDIECDSQCDSDSVQSLHRGTIDCGETIRGHTDEHQCGENLAGNPAPDHFYNFTIGTGVSFVTFNACASEYDTHLRILLPNMTEVAQCDDCGECGLQTILEAEDLPAGSYMLQIEGCKRAGLRNDIPHTINRRCPLSTTSAFAGDSSQ